MNLHQLELFVAVAESGSFSRGAEVALRTQSTASQQVAALEAECGLQLFDRTGRGVELTGAGRLLLVQARRVLDEMVALRQAMSRFQGLEETTLTIGASSIPGTYLVPGLLPELLRRYPGLSLNVVHNDSRAILEQLATGIIELALIGSQAITSGLDFTPVADDLLLLVVGPQHHWRQRKYIRLHELVDEPLLLRESGSGSGQTLFTALLAAGIDPERLQVAARLGSNEAIKESLAAGYGAAFLSERSVQREVARGELVLIPVEGLRVVRRLWLATRSGRALSPAATAFINLVKAGPELSM